MPFVGTPRVGYIRRQRGGGGSRVQVNGGGQGEKAGVRVKKGGMTKGNRLPSTRAERKHDRIVQHH